MAPVSPDRWQPAGWSGYPVLTVPHPVSDGCPVGPNHLAARSNRRVYRTVPLRARLPTCDNGNEARVSGAREGAGGWDGSVTDESRVHQFLGLRSVEESGNKLKNMAVLWMRMIIASCLVMRASLLRVEAVWLRKDRADGTGNQG